MKWIIIEKFLFVLWDFISLKVCYKLFWRRSCCVLVVDGKMIGNLNYLEVLVYLGGIIILVKNLEKNEWWLFLV